MLLLNVKEKIEKIRIYFKKCHLTAYKYKKVDKWPYGKIIFSFVIDKLDH